MGLFKAHISLICLFFLSFVLGAWIAPVGESLQIAMQGAQVEEIGIITAMLYGWDGGGAFNWGVFNAIYIVCIGAVWSVGLTPTWATALLGAISSAAFAFAANQAFVALKEKRSFLLSVASLLAVLGLGAGPIDLFGGSLVLLAATCLWGSRIKQALLWGGAAFLVGPVGCIGSTALFVSEWLAVCLPTPTRKTLRTAAVGFVMACLLCVVLLSTNRELGGLPELVSSLSGSLMILNLPGIALLLIGPILSLTSKKWRGFLLLQLPLYLAICPPIIEMNHQGGVLFSPIWLVAIIGILGLFALIRLGRLEKDISVKRGALMCLSAVLFLMFLSLLTADSSNARPLMAVAPLLLFLALWGFRKSRESLKGVEMSDAGHAILWVLLFSTFWMAPARTLERAVVQEEMDKARQAGIYALLLEDLSTKTVIDNDPSLSFDHVNFSRLEPSKVIAATTSFGNAPNFFNGFTLPPLELSSGEDLKTRHKNGEIIWMLSTGFRTPVKALPKQSELDGEFDFWLQGSMRPWLDHRQLRFTAGKAPLEKLFFRHAEPIWTWSEEKVVVPQQLFEIPYRWFNGNAVFETRMVEASVWRLCEGCP